VHDAIPHKLRVAKRGNHAEHTLLLTEFQIGLKADQIEQPPVAIFPPELNICPRTVTGARIPQSHRFERAKTDGIGTALCHDLDRHTPFVHVRAAVKIVQRRTLGGDQRRIERFILLLVHRAVEVIFLPAAFVARGIECFRAINTFGGDDRSCRVKKAEPAAADRPNLFGQCAIGQRPGRKNGKFIFRQPGKLLTANGNHRMPADFFGNQRGKLFPVHGESSSCRNTVLLCGRHQQRTEQLHFRLQQTGGAFGSLRLQ